MSSTFSSMNLMDGEKVILVGDPRVGKTSIVNRYVNDSFTEMTKPTVGYDFFKKDVKLDNGESMKLFIWDTAGQERFKCLAASYYKNASCVVLVFDLTRKLSFKKLSMWKDEIEAFGESDIVTVLVGNKSDLDHEREVNEDEIYKYAKQNGFYYLETSALVTGNGNIDTVFRYISNQLWVRRKGMDTNKRRNQFNDNNSKAFSLERRSKGRDDGCFC